MSRRQKIGDIGTHLAECKRKRIVYLTNHLMPGQKILTCSTCTVMCIVPEHQIMITHIVASGCKRHPGAVMEY